MTPAQEEAKRRAEIMLAFSEGAEIKRTGRSSGVAQTESNPKWDWVVFDYSIKPQPREPRVIYVNEFRDGSLRPHNYVAESLACESAEQQGVATRKFIEVIEEDEA